MYEMLPMGNAIGYFTLTASGNIETSRSLNMSQRNVFNYQVNSITCQIVCLSVGHVKNQI